jgi:hypothetical protein
VPTAGEEKTGVGAQAERLGSQVVKILVHAEFPLIIFHLANNSCFELIVAANSRQTRVEVAPCHRQYQSRRTCHFTIKFRFLKAKPQAEYHFFWENNHSSQKEN